ncbi:unnamed protein product, partial [marine sediment metagenome]
MDDVGKAPARGRGAFRPSPHGAWLPQSAVKEQAMKTFARGLGIVACVAAVLSGALARAGTAPGFYFADGFDEPERQGSTDMGPFWTERWSDWSIEDEHAR